MGPLRGSERFEYKGDVGELKEVDLNIFSFIIILNIKWCGNVCKWGHFGASRLRGSGRIEYKGCMGELKEIDPENSLSLSCQILI